MPKGKREDPAGTGRGAPSAESPTAPFPEAIWFVSLAGQKVLEQGLAAAQGAGAPLVEAQIHRRLGNTRQTIHDFAQAQNHYKAALALFRQHDHRPGEGEALTDLGWCSQQQHDLAQALDYLQQAAQIHRAVDNPYGESMALINLATVHEQAGDYNRAYSCWQQVLKLLEQFDDPYQRVLVNHGLGVLLSRLGEYDAAESYLLRALAMDQALGDPAGAAWTQLNLGLLYNRLMLIYRRLHCKPSWGNGSGRLNRKVDWPPPN